MVTTPSTREEILARLAAIERALADRLVIIREVIDMDRKVIATYRRTVLLNHHQEKRS